MFVIVMFEHDKQTGTQSVYDIVQPRQDNRAFWLQRMRRLCRQMFLDTGNAYELELRTDDRAVRINCYGVYPKEAV